MTISAPASDTLLVPLALSRPEVLACVQAAEAEGKANGEIGGAGLVTIRRPVRWVPSHTGLPRTHLHDFDRAWVDHGFPTDEAGDVMPMSRWGKGSADPAPESAYRQHYLHVPAVHPADGWDWEFVKRVYGPVGVGDEFWIRETFWQDCAFHYSENGGPVRYCATDEDPTPENDEWPDLVEWRKRPSIHLPRWASRLRLRVESVAVERVEKAKEGDSGWRWVWTCRPRLITKEADRG